MTKTPCETCNNYVYDEEGEYYVCEMQLDEDEAMRFMTGQTRSCPYYRSNNDYEIVKHQN